MISITVHHHHHNPSPLTSVGPCKSEAAEHSVVSQPIAAARGLSKPSINSSSSSNVEVQYRTRHFRSQSQVQQNSIKLTDSLQQLPEIVNFSQQQKNQEDLDENNNSSFTTATTSIEQETNLNQSTETAAEATRASSANVNRKLHSRSISLIINPDFSSDECPLIRRRSLPRLKRRQTQLRQQMMNQQNQINKPPASQPNMNEIQQQQQQVVAPANGSGQQQQQHHEEEEEITMNDTATNREDGQELRLRCSVSVPDFSIEETTTATTMTTMQTTITTTNITTNNTTSSSSSSETKFRQAGILLREISDEFARCRRRTI